MIAASCNPLPILDSFQSIHIHDSTIISLPASLQAWWPGVGSAQGETAALKLQVDLDYKTGQVSGPVAQPGRSHDQTSPFHRQCLPAGALRLADLGFFNLNRLAEDQSAGVFWITRFKVGTRVYSPEGQELELVTWLPGQNKPVLDVPVTVGQKLHLPCRLIAVRVPQEVADQRRRRLKEWARKKQKAVSDVRLKMADWTVVVTNVPAERLSAEQVLTLLHVRWQVELLFKLWKSQAKIDEWRSQNPWRILCDIYAKLIGLAMSQWLYAVCLWPYPDRSLFQAAKIVQAWAMALTLAFHDCDQLLKTVTMLATCLTQGCRQQKRRAHPATFQRLHSLC